MYKNPIKLYTVSIDYMFLTFYKASFMDSELIDQRMNVVYRSGERVILSPLYIMVFLIPPLFYFSAVGELHCQRIIQRCCALGVNCIATV